MGVRWLACHVAIQVWAENLGSRVPLAWTIIVNYGRRYQLKMFQAGCTCSACGTGRCWLIELDAKIAAYTVVT